MPALPPGGEHVAEVAIEAGAGLAAGTARRVTVIAQDAGGRATRAADITLAEPGWTMWMVSHFHYDPVWWSTQGQFLESRLFLPDDDGELPEVRTAFELVRAAPGRGPPRPGLQVRAGRDRLPQAALRRPPRGPGRPAGLHQGGPDRARRRHLQRAQHQPDRAPSPPSATPSTGWPTSAACWRGEPRTAWMLDAFGFDPAFPGLMAAAGLAESSWARGPFHQWGPGRTAGRQPADAVRRPSSSGCRRTAPGC